MPENINMWFVGDQISSLFELGHSSFYFKFYIMFLLNATQLPKHTTFCKENLLVQNASSVTAQSSLDQLAMPPFIPSTSL